VLGDEKTLYPNIVETLSAAQTLVNDGFNVMVYTSDDPIVAKELAAAASVASFVSVESWYFPEPTNKREL
jgi:thiazole synthase